MLFVELGNVRQHLQQEFQKRGQVVDPASQDKAEVAVKVFVAVFYGAFIFSGLLFIVMAMFVQKYPVPITIIALVLFIALQVIAALVDVTNLASGWLFKIIMIVALVKALQAGLAAQKEARLAANADYD
jgi:hypothetical protein